eukprot:755256-Hanusia_phi.AAC.2
MYQTSGRRESTAITQKAQDNPSLQPHLYALKLEARQRYPHGRQVLAVCSPGPFKDMHINHSLSPRRHSPWSWRRRPSPRPHDALPVLPQPCPEQLKALLELRLDLAGGHGADVEEQVGVEACGPDEHADDLLHGLGRVVAGVSPCSVAVEGVARLEGEGGVNLQRAVRVPLCVLPRRILLEDLHVLPPVRRPMVVVADERL